MGVASESEVKNETECMVQTLNLLNCVWSNIRTVRDTVFNDAKTEDIVSNIKLLQRHWCCKREWESESISFTFKWYLLFHHIQGVLTQFRLICHSAEDPAKKRMPKTSILSVILHIFKIQRSTRGLRSKLEA